MMWTEKHKGGVEAAPESAYAPEDRAFYKFWYAHMKDDQMLLMAMRAIGEQSNG